MLVLGILLGPNEVKLHRINHYLTPIVDELLEFWDGIDLPVNNKYPTGKNEHNRSLISLVDRQGL